MGFDSDGGGEKYIEMEKGCLIFLPTCWWKFGGDGDAALCGHAYMSKRS